jgi:hypothetical protein
MGMNKIQARRIYSLWLATSIKFMSITPVEILDEVIEYCEESDPPPLPVSLQPYQESIKMCRNMLTMISHVTLLKDQFRQMYDELTEEFDEMNEETFIEWYRKQRSES